MGRRGRMSAGRGHGELGDDVAALRRTVRADHRHAYRRGAGDGHHDDRRRLAAVVGDVDKPWTLTSGDVADALDQVGGGSGPRRRGGGAVYGTPGAAGVGPRWRDPGRGGA